jgi:glutathione synthase/RimK-type ligase-like ATP-grasp enzyme
MPLRTSVLLVASPTDMHTDVLARYLSDHGHKFIRIWNSLFAFAGGLRLAITDSGRWEGQVSLFGKEHILDLSQLSAVWWRRPGPFANPRSMSESAKEFTRSEFHHALAGLWAVLDCYWMNHPVAIQSASYKFEQLKRARDHGFTIPDTIITTSLDEAREFVFRQANCTAVYKILTASSVVLQQSIRQRQDSPAELSVTTTAITEQTMRDLKTLGPAPCQFQQFLRKRREYRVTVIGDEVFAVCLEPNEIDATTTDWRPLAYSAPMRQVVLPPALESRCHDYVHGYGLTFGALDLVETVNGELFFLELNPAGQFLFIQQRLPGMRLLEAAAACLVRKAA